MTCEVCIFGVGKFGSCFVKFNVALCLYLFGFCSVNLIWTRNLLTISSDLSFLYFLIAKLFIKGSLWINSSYFYILFTLVLLSEEIFKTQGGAWPPWPRQCQQCFDCKIGKECPDRNFFSIPKVDSCFCLWKKHPEQQKYHGDFSYTTNKNTMAHQLARHAKNVNHGIV